jgi:hypothetical protein
LGVGVGRSGSIRFHKASGRRDVAMKLRQSNSDALSYHAACTRIGFVTASKAGLVYKIDKGLPKQG